MDKENTPNFYMIPTMNLFEIRKEPRLEKRKYAHRRVGFKLPRMVIHL